MKTRTRHSLLLHGALIFGAAVNLAPFAWMISASFMAPGETSAEPPHLLPDRATFDQYVTLFTRLDLARHFLNSVIITLTATVGSVFINSMIRSKAPAAFLSSLQTVESAPTEVAAIMAYITN